MASTQDPASFKISDADLDKFDASGRDFVDHLLMDASRDGIAPQLNVIQRHWTATENELACYLIQTSFNTHQEKHGILANIGLKLAEARIVPVAWQLLSEAWGATCADENEIRKYLCMADMPHRREVAICATMALGGRMRISVLNVKRDEHNNMLPDGEWVVSDKGDPNILVALLRGFAAGMLQVHNAIFG